ncbi:LysE family translocator [Candidatus Pseudothioglobus singularis]|jgi:threonine/homoserine/homoserine lactone efflux protein|uniref:LysE family translocator n=1 Tax=Candidatus Pseudothioglobus singularis TaxID=1427364 RepID=UPI00037EC170|nr:LysE family translocator [Candidatus Pseudothioglobus singularis]ANQ65937.1 lysine exporter (LYSE/YGGA) [Candidatus Pseudothioglobus singularis]MDA8691634.1 LysE family translocator [Candidatus Pseudothioglobus singularis]MDA9030597.1 LysE family translocator [Candidatus Pseudothioglobus singularis]MDA9802038.1 LysE family translocator [Candidatus Pseudothioglobus singularis]MDB0021653.1 LysE family translocator [Candidatus Pseudothioglobus singularis]
MDLLTLLSLMIATFVYAISPGPGLFAVLAISTRFGPIPAIWVSIGHTVGDIIYVALAMLALNALAEVINESMLYVKILGASYLIFIGYQQFRSKGISFEPSSKKSSVIKLLIAGFVVGVTNPKTIIFYLSFLPIFIDLNNLTLNTEVQVIVAIGLTVFFVLSLANILGVRLRSYIENPDSIRRINQVTGVTMILVGVFVALY